VCLLKFGDPFWSRILPTMVLVLIISNYAIEIYTLAVKVCQLIKRKAISSNRFHWLFATNSKIPIWANGWLRFCGSGRIKSLEPINQQIARRAAQILCDSWMEVGENDLALLVPAIVTEMQAFDFSKVLWRVCDRQRSQRSTLDVWGIDRCRGQ